MLKFRNPLILLVLTVIAFLLFNACEMKKGGVTPNLDPIISITEYFGANEIGDVGNAQIFQQTINWSAYDPDGVVKGFSFRILNQDGVAIPTPGYEVLDEAGWVKHYNPNANTNIPLEESDETTIWLTKQGLASQSTELYTTSVTINFPAADANGDSTNIVSQFQVRCIDNNGGISNIATKFFNAFSNKPKATVQSSKGIINGETIGLGVVFEFAIPDDPNINSASSEAYYYKYKLEKKDIYGNVIPEAEGGYPEYADGDWPDTYGQTPNNILLITTETPITLKTNTWDDTTSTTPIPLDSTYIYVKGINVAGIQTDVTVISFLVSDKFAPGTIIYYGEGQGQKNDVYALGQNHFATYLDESMSATVPSIETFTGIHNATPMWVNEEEEYQAIGSEDFKVYMHWGWNGEFEENNPFKKMADETLDEDTNSSYFAEITAFDLRLDGEPLYYPPLPAVGDYLKVDEDGTEWLRVPIWHPISQRVTLNATSLGGFNSDTFYGMHTFEARSVDLQDVVDPTPHTFSFNVYRPISKSDKDGILIIDEEAPNPTFSPGAYIDSVYATIVQNFDSDPGYINLIELKSIISNDLNLFDLHFKKSIISPAEIQQYKTIIFHSDNPTSESSFWKEYESLKIYLSQGGNLILSAGSNLKTLQNKLRANAFPILQNYFGIPLEEEDAILKASEDYKANPFFIQAISEVTDLPDLDLLLPSFNSFINQEIFGNGGMAPIGYFDENAVNSEIIYSYGSKPVNTDIGPSPFGFYTYPQTQEVFDQFNGLPVGLRYSTPNNYNTCVIFSFPLSYMNLEDVTAMMNSLLPQLGH